MLKREGPLLEQETLLIIYFVAILLFFTVFTVVFVIAFQRRKNKFLVERLEVAQRFEKEIEKSKLEIQEQTFKNIAWELHDNVGQLLSVVNIQLNMLSHTVPPSFHPQIDETKDVVKDAVHEIRTLSKILNNDVILKNGILTSIELELERFNKLSFLEAKLKVEGTPVAFKNTNEIILFRILQESFSNIIKHAKAKKLFVLLSYKENLLEIEVKDDGVGFDTSLITDSSGMETMKSRAELLHLDFSINSTIGKGTTIFLKYPYQND
ncbi:sensor histidine kinase [Ulvibacter litoralis]|uniref:Histidine kinase/HSP90-like ATPase domain-containing protein n=1 Tax=Ulvibacter litoralis TaxID=227084 RepID=A0A1G7HIT7_9FLAO|nr:histidine kinase [Ulvibacter litoralis]GHC57985.1 hypothetical protein GCM10008083_23290 [Ulvibacter litoralis]SDF00345.1 hypothetical protein SAMN05421855_104119 [Ulvibacter litoralis]